MRAWKVASSLDQLLAQLDQVAPRRSRASDGAIGDAAHASRASDHNPWVVLAGQAYVTARDFTHDPAGGMDCAWLAEQLERARDPRVKYVIWSGRIMAGAGGPHPWTWRTYSGSNPHLKHLHLSVVADARALAATPWQLEDTMPIPEPATPDDVWSHPVRDLYRGGQAFRAVDALEWAARHGATTQDRLGELEAKLDEVLAKVDRVLAELAPGAQHASVPVAEPPVGSAVTDRFGETWTGVDHHGEQLWTREPGVRGAAAWGWTSLLQAYGPLTAATEVGP